MTPAPYLLPVEVVYRQIAEPKPPKPARVDEQPTKAEPLTRDDVNAFIERKRHASPEQLEYIIDNAKEFSLTQGERNQLGVDLTIAMSEQARNINGKRDDPNARLIHSLGYADTPFGLLPERGWFEKQLQIATQAIAACRRHSPPRCSCWRDAREALYTVGASFGERSPESWAAIRVWEALEEIELASRPERGRGSLNA
jgi:hypothetical protein